MEDRLFDPEIVHCPQCSAAVDAASSDGPVLQCPACGTQFFRPAAEESEPSNDDEQTPDDPQQSEAELSELRIRQMVTLCRSAYRTRSYLIVGMLGCLGLAIQLIIFAVHNRHDRRPNLLAFCSQVFFAVAALIGSGMFGVKVVEAQRQIIAQRKLREAEEAEIARHPPDLSLLSDGSQQARNLEAMVPEPAKREPPPSE